MIPMVGTEFREKMVILLEEIHTKMSNNLFKDKLQYSIIRLNKWDISTDY